MYTSWTYITDPIGNNGFSYPERIALWSVAKIFVPSLVEWSPDDLEVWSEICFEEAVNNKLISCVGLKHFIQTEYEWIPVYIVDNHNHALSFRHQKLMTPLIKGEASVLSASLRVSADADGGFEKTKKRLVVLHIDQHADMKPNDGIMKGDRERFVNEKTNVGNFISAALANWIISEVIQVRTDYALQEIKIRNPQFVNPLIIDIDVDFRADKEIVPEDIRIIRELMKKAKLVTIATSPYFMEQKSAIEIIKKLLA